MKNNLLDIDTLDLPAPEIFSVFSQKQPRKKNAQPQSTFSLYHSDGRQIVTFFVEHSDNYPSGGFASKVKKCFVLGQGEPQYALKIFKQHLFHNNQKHQLRIAMRSAYCSTLLGRTGLVFRHHEKQYLLTDWLPGTTLENAPRITLQTIPIPNRITLALTLLNELATLHEHDICHHDIKPSNVMLSSDGLHLFDFDSARIKNEMHEANQGFIFTPSFLDAPTNWALQQSISNLSTALTKKSDLYALGLTLSFLFPELLSPYYGRKNELINQNQEMFEFDSVILSQGPKFLGHQTLSNFILNLSTTNHPRFNSIHDVINGLTHILHINYASHFIAPASFVNAVNSSQIEQEIRSFDTRQQRIHRFLQPEHLTTLSKLPKKPPSDSNFNWITALILTGVALFFMKNKEAHSSVKALIIATSLLATGCRCVLTKTIDESTDSSITVLGGFN